MTRDVKLGIEKQIETEVLYVEKSGRDVPTCDGAWNMAYR